MDTAPGKSRRSILVRAAVLSGCAWALFPALSQVTPTLPPVAAQAAVSPGDAFRKMSSDPWVSRVITFAELGLPPIVLGYPDTLRDVTLPVPPGVQLHNATLQMDASFVRADGGRTTLILSLDGLPSSARAVPAERGDGSVTLAVDGAPRTSGVLRFGVDWRTNMGRENTCADQRTPGNLLRIEPTSRLSYRFDGSTLQDLPSAWAVLPASPVVLVMGSRMSAQAYDSAWRVGVALERTGKHPRIRVIPTVGEVVDLQGVVVPAPLRAIPAFAALADGGKRRIKDLAELGALMALGQAGPLQADIVVGDRASRGLVAQALDELRAQLPQAALEPFAEWRERALDGWGKQLAPGQLRVANVFGRPAIVVAPDAGAQLAGLFSQSWQHAGAQALNVISADDPRSDVSSVSLKYLGAKPGSLDVVSRADWSAGFHVSALAAEGRRPASLVIDVAAAPGAARTTPVASVFMNDVLLAARELEAHGKRERIVAPVPRHVLGAQNTIRVSFVRQQATDRCRETPESYPVSVLASSHMTLDKIDPGPDFSGLITRFANGANLLVPVTYLQDAGNSLPRVISLAASTGVSPSRATFTAVADAGPHKVKGPFLALDVALHDTDSEVKVEAGRLYLAGGSDRPLLDVNGLMRPGLIEVVKHGGQVGAAYRSLGREGPVPDRPMQLTQGNVAVFGSNGLRAEINTWDPTGQRVVGETRPTLVSSANTWPGWLLTLGFVGGLGGWGWRAWRRKLRAGHP